MLMLLFQLGNSRYAIPARDVVEVTPRVQLEPLAKVPAYIAGLFNYRGESVPVIDLCQVIRNRHCEDSFTTRVILVTFALPGGSARTLGLLAESVTDTVNVSDSEFSSTGVRVDDAPFLGHAAQSQLGLIHKISVSELLPASVQSRLFPTEPA